MGYDFHPVCTCGSYHSEYTVRTGQRICRRCGALLSVHGVSTPASPLYGMTEEEVDKYFETGIDPRSKQTIPQPRIKEETPEDARDRKAMSQEQMDQLLSAVNGDKVVNFPSPKLSKEEVDKLVETVQDEFDISTVDYVNLASSLTEDLIKECERVAVLEDAIRTAYSLLSHIVPTVDPIDQEDNENINKAILYRARKAVAYLEKYLK